jgi:arylsulfatase A-like enzyme
MNTSPSGRWHGFVLAQLLAIALLLLSGLRIAGDSQSMLFNSNVLDALFAGPIWGTVVARNLMFFAAAALLLHMAFGALCWALGRASSYAWSSANASQRQHIILWFLLLTAGLLAYNAAAFTRSSLGEPYAAAMGNRIAGVPLGYVLWWFALFAVAIALTAAAVRWWRNGGRPTRRSWVALGAAGFPCLAFTAFGMFTHPAAATADRPNIIFIGLDSFRTDILDPMVVPRGEQFAPHVEAFMKGGVSFADAITPLARTFPSLMALLTGRSPHRSGAFVNLLPRDRIDDSTSLPRLLKQAGYQTAYATDEVRFANIDTTYGFDQTITPPIGASDFLIAKIADSPVTNLVVNTQLGRWLFPHVHANRGAAITYDPDTFVARIDDTVNPSRPLFMLAHLTLVHWPYTWADSPRKIPIGDARWPDYYLKAAHRVDRQFSDLMNTLRDKGLLDNAIVVVFSDHGESFSHHDGLVPEEDPLIKALKIEPDAGHGTSVLASHQYRIVLGIRRYGDPRDQWQAGTRLTVPATLQDIAPTIVQILGLPAPSNFDGRSMLPMLNGEPDAALEFGGRVRFTETEYQPAGLMTADGTIAPMVLGEAVSVYHVDRDTDRIQLIADAIEPMRIDRQYAALGSTQTLGTFPGVVSSERYFLAVPNNGGEPRLLVEEPVEPELQLLWRALRVEFGSVVANARPMTPVADSVQTVPLDVTK